MQLHGWGRGSTQHVLQGWQAGLALGGQLGLLLLEDGQREHITATHRGRGQEQRRPLGEVDADPVLQGSPAKHRAESWVSFPGLTAQTLSERANQPAMTLLSLNDPQEIYSIKSLTRKKMQSHLILQITETCDNGTPSNGVSLRCHWVSTHKKDITKSCF